MKQALRKLLAAAIFAGTLSAAPSAWADKSILEPWGLWSQIVDWFTGDHESATIDPNGK